jgi:hypothetical protein
VIIALDIPNEVPKDAGIGIVCAPPATVDINRDGRAHPAPSSMTEMKEINAVSRDLSSTNRSGDERAKVLFRSVQQERG